MLSAALLITLASAASALQSAGDLGKLPALGWNSWNAYACNIDEGKVMSAANLMVSLGLKDAGYQYVNIDDCWSVKTGRDSTGHLMPDMTKFPDGISGTASKVHALGLKFGIYSDAGKTTCGGYPASLGYEVTDAQTFANWGVDYLKYDNCDVPSNWADQYQDCVPSDTSNVGPQGQCPKTSSSAPAGYNWGTSNTAKRYGAMRDAILKTGRPMLFSLCNWGGEHVWEWGKSVGHSWRISGDVYPSWNRITAIANWNAFILQYTNFWGHNDADMLEVGNGQLTSQETRSHFALWAAMKSPLIIGTDLSKLPQADVDLLKNQYLLKFHQDNTYGGPATPFKWNRQFNPNHPTCQYWSGDATAWVFVLVFNSADSQQTLSFKWTDVPQLRASSGQRYTYTDGWTGQAHNCVSNGVSVTLAAHDSAIYAVQRNHC